MTGRSDRFDDLVYRIKVTFVDKEGDEHHFEVSQGDNLLDIAQANDLEMEGVPSSNPSLRIRIADP